jgi:hypothetical protein
MAERDRPHDLLAHGKDLAVRIGAHAEEAQKPRTSARTAVTMGEKTRMTMRIGADTRAAAASALVMA